MYHLRSNLKPRVYEAIENAQKENYNPDFIASLWKPIKCYRLSEENLIDLFKLLDRNIKSSDGEISSQAFKLRLDMIVNSPSHAPQFFKKSILRKKAHETQST